MSTHKQTQSNTKPEAPSPRLICYAELRPRKGINYSRMQLSRLMAAKRFPKALRFSATRIAWLENEIDAWIAEKAAARS